MADAKTTTPAGPTTRVISNRPTGDPKVDFAPGGAYGQTDGQALAIVRMAEELATFGEQVPGLVVLEGKTAFDAPRVARENEVGNPAGGTHYLSKRDASTLVQLMGRRLSQLRPAPSPVTSYQIDPATGEIIG